MDFQYTFRQAHQDRLEDAGVIQYRPTDGFRVQGRKRQHNRPVHTRRLRRIVATLVSIFTR